MIRDEDVFKIGRIGKPHGVHGELTMMIDDDVFDRVDAEFLILRIDGILVPFFIDEYRFRTDTTVLIRFCDITTQDKAKELTGCDVFFPRNLSDNDAEHLSWAEIIGYSVIESGTDRLVGSILSVDDSTANTLFEVSIGDDSSVLLPANDDLIAGVDVKNRTITMHLPEGILDLN